MAVTTAVVAAVSATASGVASTLSAQAQNKAQRKAGKLERARANIDRQREIRRAVAARRLQEGELLQASEASGARSNSAVAGAVGSLRTRTASGAGALNTSFATDIAQSRILQRGATRSARFGGAASLFGGVSQASSAIASSPKAQAAIKKFFT